MSTKRPAKKDFDMERMYQKLMPSMQAEFQLPEIGPEIPEVESPPLASAVPAEQLVQAVNLTELLLREKMEHTMKMLRACDCPRCRADILAHALNRLPCCYAVDEATFADKITELRRQYEVKATSALIQAVQQVKAEPRH